MARKKRTARSQTAGSALAPAVKPSPDVTMNLTVFHEISTGGTFCTLGDSGIIPVTITSQGNGKGIKHPNGDPFTNGIVLSGGAKIIFDVRNFDQSVSSVAIVGCIIVPRSGAPVADNFNKISWDPDSLTIFATHKDKSSSWKLYVAITAVQAGGTKLGIIDPDIENDANANVPAP